MLAMAEGEVRRGGCDTLSLVELTCILACKVPFEGVESVKHFRALVELGVEVKHHGRGCKLCTLWEESAIRKGEALHGLSAEADCKQVRPRPL